MPVVSLNVGARRIHVTAYCPRDVLGLLACDYALAVLKEVCDNTTPAQLRLWLEERVPGARELYVRLDAGWVLPTADEFSIDPTNAVPEQRIIAHLMRERLEQTCGQHL